MTLREKIQAAKDDWNDGGAYQGFGADELDGAELDRLLLALDTLEAVEWIEQNNMEVRRLPQLRDAPAENWLVGNEQAHSPYCNTLPEAVAKLRAALEKEEG